MLMARLSGSVSDTWLAPLFSRSWARLCSSFLRSFSCAIFALISCALSRSGAMWFASSWASLWSNSSRYAHLVLNLGQQCFEFPLAVIAPLGVLRLDLGRINRHQFSAKKLQLAAQQDKFTAHRLDRFAIVAAKVSDGFEVRPQFAQQPDQFQIARRLPLQAAAGTHPVEIAIEIEPQQISWIIGRPPSLIELCVGETGFAQIELPGEGIDETHRIFRRDVIIQDFGQQQRLASITSSNVVHAGIGACQTNIAFATITSSEKKNTFHTVSRCSEPLAAPLHRTRL